MEYKNILWIDDCDDNNSGGDISNMQDKYDKDTEPAIKYYFKKMACDVCLMKEYKKALEELKVANSKYDLVVFDVNMKAGVDVSEFEDIKRTLKEKMVVVTDEYSTFIEERAGMYLYLFLLNCGYPSERMVVLTTYEEEVKTFCKEAHIYVNEKNLVKKDLEKMKRYDWEGEFYNDKYEYYQIRRLVYKACEYWKEKLGKAGVVDDQIAFNKIYFRNGGGVEKDSFINMLDKIELFFSVITPEKPKNVYYLALQTVSMFHEESAKINYVKGSMRKYHQAVRNFRNWSAHNKFSCDEIDGELFAYIFCIALRTYFEDKDKQFDVPGNGCFKDYEDKYWGNSMSNINPDFTKFEGNYQAAINRHIRKVLTCREYKDISNLLFESGCCTYKKMLFSDIFLNILDDEWIENVRSRIVPVREGTKGTSCSLEWKFTCQYDWKRNGKTNILAWWKQRQCEQFKDYAYYLWIKMTNTGK